MTKKKAASLEQIEEVLKANHFYPGKTTEGKKQGLYLDCAAIILMDDRVARINDVLESAGISCKVWGDKNKGVIYIEKGSK